MAKAKAKTEPTIDVTAVEEAKSTKKDWRSLLPPYYRTGYTTFMRRAQSLDPEYKHFWVNKFDRNQHIRIYQGWLPLEDRQRLEDLGVGNLIKATGRATWMDVELWRQPLDVNRAVRRAEDEKLAEQSAGMRAALDADADEVAGRTGNRAIPFITSGNTGDVFDRRPVAAPEVATGKK